MALTNAEIIRTECRKHGITEQVKTMPQWKKEGYSIAAGTYPLFSTGIWKPVKEGNMRKIRMVNTGFFGKSQVSR